MGRILLVRHGETDWNKGESRWVGWTDPPLNAAGKRQAKSVARRLEKEPLSAIYSSDLRRTSETAEIIARPHRLPVLPRADLREVNYGEWEGLSEEECRVRDPDLLALRMQDPENTAPPGGESYRCLLNRSLAAIEEVAARHRDESVAVVSHHGNLRLLFCHLLKVPIRQYRSFMVYNASVSLLLSRGNRLIIQAINDTCHLKQSEE